MRFKNIAFAAAVLLIAVTALSGCKGQGESGGNSSAFLKEERDVYKRQLLQSLVRYYLSA